MLQFHYFLLGKIHLQDRLLKKKKKKKSKSGKFFRLSVCLLLWALLFIKKRLITMTYQYIFMLHSFPSNTKNSYYILLS